MSHNKKIKGYDSWEIEGAADTLIRAQELRADKVLFNLAQAEVRKKAAAAQAAIAPPAKRVRKKASSVMMSMKV